MNYGTHRISCVISHHLSSFFFLLSSFFFLLSSFFFFLSSFFFLLSSFFFLLSSFFFLLSSFSMFYVLVLCLCFLSLILTLYSSFFYPMTWNTRKKFFFRRVLSENILYYVFSAICLCKKNII